MSDEQAMADALRFNAPALSRMGVLVKAPWWRRKIQSRVTPRRFRLWLQREVLTALDAPASGSQQ